MKKPSLAIVFLTVFIDLVGFGIVFPLLPIFAAHCNAKGWEIGALIASYSAMQFVFSPIWGRWSDRIGRRPVLLISTAGAAVSYVIFTIGSGMSGSAGLAVLFISRVFAGACGANITVAQAYIADITPPEQRSKKMGLVGMAFGLGFILGPVVGGLGLKFLGQTGPGWIAAGLCAVNFVFSVARLPESRKADAVSAPQRPHLDQFIHTLKTPRIGMLVFLFFAGTLVFSAFEMTVGLLVSGNFNLAVLDDHGVKQFDSKIVYIYAFCGIIGALVQGKMIGRLVDKFGEPGVIILSFFLVALSVGPLPWMKPGFGGWTGLLVFLAALSIGSSLARPPIFGMISILSPEVEQGAALGVAQSAGSLARIFAPLIAGVLFDAGPALPYITSAVVALAAGVLAWKRLGGFRPPKAVA